MESTARASSAPGSSPRRSRNLHRAYRLVYRNGLRVPEALERLEEMRAGCPDVAPFIEFLAASSRGIVRQGRR